MPPVRPAVVPRPAVATSGAAVAVAVAALQVLVLATASGRATTVLALVLVTASVPIALVDLRERRIPNRLTLPTAVAAVVAGTVLDPGGQPERIGAAVAAATILLVPALLRPDGMGMGDVKLAGVLGLCLGAPVAVALLVALVGGTLAGVAIAARAGLRAARTATLPFGPYLVGGGVVAIVLGEPALDAYRAMGPR